VTLGACHQAVDTAEQAAEALRPFARPLASELFGIGLLASFLIAVPVLATTSSYLLTGASLVFIAQQMVR
jgi:Mn2+/Fe2+ NRAMP family transporter